MDYEGFKLRSIIFDNKFLLERETFLVHCDDGADYEFLVHDIGSNALDISLFRKYLKISSSSDTIEKQLLNIITGRVTNPYALATVAEKRKAYIWGKGVY